MSRPCVTLLALVVLLCMPASAAGHLLPSRHLETLRPVALRLSTDPSKPLFTVGITGGFTGAHMLARVYGDGRVLTVRTGTNGPGTQETHVALSRAAVQVVLDAAVRRHVFSISRRVQDTVFGADVPLLSFSIATTRGVRSVHVMGGEASHPAGTATFFPIWSLLHALAGYPPQIG